MTRLLSIISFGLFIANVICSIENLNEELKFNFKSSIIQKFYPVVTSAVDLDKVFLPLLNVTDEIDGIFHSCKNIVTVFDELINYMTLKLIWLRARNSKTCTYLLDTFIKIYDYRKREYNIKRTVLINTQALGTMADVCHHFKAPVQWLSLTSKVLGHANLFQDAPTLLENIRKAFLEKFDPKIDSVDFKVKLKFIKDSFDINFLQPESNYGNSSSIHLELKSEFMRQISVVINDLEKVSNPFAALSTGLGQRPIVFNLGSNLTSSNEDLWNFIIQRIENIRERIEFNSSNLIRLHGISIIDLVISKVIEKSRNNVPFLLKKVHIAISESFKYYISLIESAHEDETINVDILKHEAEQIKTLFEAYLKEFYDDLKLKICEIKSEYGFTSSNSVNIDLNLIALGSMAFEFLKESHL